ncbi:MAG: GYD domain-containing protein [Rhodomicrobium sp.]
MATYIMLAKFTDQGIRNVKDTVKRAEAFKEKAQKHGATVKDIYWTLGTHDMVTILEAPDEGVVLTLGLAAGAMGNVRTETLRAFGAEQVKNVLEKIS